MDEFDELAPPEQRAHDQAGPPSPMDAPFPSSAEHSQKHTRRIFLFKLSLGLNALVGAVLAVPILGYVLAPMFKKDNSYNQGALVFQHKQCRNCHALEGVGGQRGPALDKIAARMSDDQLIRQVLQGGGNMPAFGKSLTPAETTALVSFLGTLPRQRKRE